MGELNLHSFITRLLVAGDRVDGDHDYNHALVIVDDDVGRMGRWDPFEARQPDERGPAE